MSQMTGCIYLNRKVFPEERIGLGLEVRRPHPRPRGQPSEQGRIWQRILLSAITGLMHQTPMVLKAMVGWTSLAGF